MHYLQSLLTLLIASNVPAERIWGILASSGFVFSKEDGGELVFSREWGWISASALKREMKKRASLCSQLFKDWERRVPTLSALNWKTTCLPLDSGTKLIRHQDGTIECQALGKKLTIHDDSSCIYSRKPSWQKDPGLNAYEMRLQVAWSAERSLWLAVTQGDEMHTHRFRLALSEVDTFMHVTAAHQEEMMERHLAHAHK